MATAQTSTPPSPKYKVIGTRPVRHDGIDKVTGRASYGADVQLSGTLSGWIVRSPHAHARIVSIDTSAAEAVPGVRAVVTNADLPEVSDDIEDLGEGAVSISDLNANVLARNKALYRGHAVAGVAADTVHIAEEAAALIRVEYEPLPPVLDVREAMHEDAPLLHDDLLTKEFGETITQQPSNVAARFFYEQGELEKAFDEAALVIEREFRTATVHQGYIEPHSSTAMWNADGHLTVWTCTQGSFAVRQQLSDLLDIPQTYIKVIPTEIGGGFGGKISVYLEPVAALLSRKTGRPVKLTMSRADVFEATGPTPATYMRVKLGVDKEGRIVAGDAYLAYEAGAFPGSPINPGCMCVFACYDIPNARVEGYDVCTTKPRTNAYRAPGSTSAAFATETVVDEICRELEIDPIEFRLNNAAREGTRRVDGVTYPRIGMWETADAIKASEHWNSPIKKEPPPVLHATGNGSAARLAYGRGLASGFWFNAGLKSSLSATVNADGKVSLVEGSTDIGGTRTSIAMQLAETLGIPAEDINPLVADTDSVGYNDVTGGSRVTHTTGMAAYEAGMMIRGRMIQGAAAIWNVDEGDLQYEEGGVAGPEGKRMTFGELAAKLSQTGEPLSVTATVSAPSAGGAFGTHLVDVAVDIDTGKVDVLRYTAAQDVGTAIHPSYVEGQIQGGVAQGVGWALNEEYFYDETGRMRNATYLDYRMPTCLDLPMIDCLLVEVPNPNHPYGVRGVGEVPIVPPPAAIAAAVYDATGVRLYSLPMSPATVVKKLTQQGGAAAGSSE
ncbi:MAG: xanthine dehydrogenase family protein molybdopterin-binding subunit [Planctomycetota bacterium]|nr:MAG: xanthine dehydrogenase family protein molybdopterin-binding subunit [Planctomycetota bacterium]